ncbi:MAG: LD-carboxypeptidase [Lachnospiraceae bacterium]|nr:LD-carboxypeptidase [Lachnospiraceae bacterium]
MGIKNFKKIAFFSLLLISTFLFVSCEKKEVEIETISEGTETDISVEYEDYVGKNKNLFLEQGDKIAVISPSATPSREQVDKTIEGLKNLGYEPVEGKFAYGEVRTKAEIIEDLLWALNDPSIKAIFSVRGGYGASEIMEEIPIELIKNSNKMIIGYSDITVYHSAWTMANVLSIHSSMSSTFIDLPKECAEATAKIFKGQIPIYNCNENNGKTGEATGVLIGGNLSTFTSVIGTKFDSTKINKPYILFLEDVGEDLEHIHRYLTILKHQNILKNAKGIIFGEWVDLPADLGDYLGKSRGGKYASIVDMIKREFTNELDIPIAFNFPAGHGSTNYPLLMGEMVNLKVQDSNYNLKYLAPIS